MTSWIDRRLHLIKVTEELLRKGLDYEEIISKLGKQGVARRKALEYIKSIRIIRNYSLRRGKNNDKHL